MGKKPPVAHLSELKARTNIERKLERLARFLEQGADPSELPKSLNQFNSWAFEGGSANECFVGHAHDTLTRHSDLKARAIQLTDLASSFARPKPPTREASVRRAREQAGLHLQLRHIAESHALRVMSENRDLRKEIEGLRAQIDSMATESASIRREYEEELQKVRSRNAELLRSTPSTIKALRSDA